MKKLEEKINRFKIKLDEIIEEENKLNKAKVHFSRTEFIPYLDYVWVVFKNNETPDQLDKLYEKEHPVAVLCRYLFCIPNYQAQMASFED